MPSSSCSSRQINDSRDEDEIICSSLALSIKKLGLLSEIRTVSYELLRITAGGRRRTGEFTREQGIICYLTRSHVLSLFMLADHWSRAMCNQWVSVWNGSLHIVRCAVYFRSVFVEICNHSYFLKPMTLRNSETNVSIFIENFLAAILDIQKGRHQTTIFVHYSSEIWWWIWWLSQHFWGQENWRCNPKYFWITAIIKSKMAAVDRIP